jgi:5-methylcytosine-specific restriction endonuclease McrA
MPWKPDGRVCRYCSTSLTHPRGVVCRDIGCRRRYKADGMRCAKAAQKAAVWKPRDCEGCGRPIPITRRSDTKHCSRACIEKRRSARGERIGWQDAYRQRRTDLQREYRKQNPARTRTYRNQRQRNAVGSVSDKDWSSVLRQYRGCCAYCSVEGPMTMDHVVPLSRGGRHTIGNVVPACGPCNSSKFNKLLVEWRIFRQRRIHALEG